MNYLLVYLLESSICLAVFYLFYLLVLQNQPSHQYNRLYLIATSLLSFILPVLEIPVLADAGISQVAGTYRNYILLDPVMAATEETTTSGQSWSWTDTLLLLYAAGVLTALGKLFSQLFQLMKVVNKSQIEDCGHYQLVYTEGRLPSSSFFSYLFWDNTLPLSQEEARQVMAHEKAHIKAGHSYDIMYFSLLRILFWFQPLVYLYERALIDVHEYEADASAIREQTPAHYARLLARSMFAGLELSLVNHFYKSRTIKRIKMMKLTNQQTPRYKYFLALPLLMLMVFTFSCQEDSEMSKLDKLQGQYETAETEEEKLMLSDADEVFMVVENQPAPEGGMEEFYKYLMNNLKYPEQAKAAGIEGKVFVQFVVDTDGSITDVKAIKGIGAGCNAEAERVLKEAAPWNPGTQKGKFVKVRMVLPITFKLDDTQAAG
ncbi:MAG: TonB family protein [Cyclobacteriaceae bacterium]